MHQLLSISSSFDRFKSVEVLSLLFFQPKEHDIALNVFSSDSLLELRKLAFGSFELKSEHIDLLSATFVWHFLCVLKLFELFFELFMLFLQSSIIVVVLYLFVRRRLSSQFSLQSSDLISIGLDSLFEIIFFFLELLRLLLEMNRFFIELHYLVVELFLFFVAISIFLLFV